MLLPPGQQAEGDGVGEHPHAETVKPDTFVGAGGKGWQTVTGNQGDRQKQDCSQRDPKGSHPDGLKTVESQLHPEKGPAPHHAKKSKQPPVEGGWRLAMEGHQVTFLRVRNSGRSHRRSFITMARRSTACQTSTKRV